MSLDVGQTYEAQLSVTNAAGQPVNPSAATLTITLPDQTTVTPAITLPPATTGLLTYDFVATQAGLHKFAWSTTGPAVAKTNYESFRNFASAISLQRARDRLGLTSTARDEQVRLLMAAATREVEKVTGILIPRVFTDDWIPGTYRDLLRVPHGPLLNENAVTSLRSAYPLGPSWAVTDLVVNPNPGIIRHAGLIPFWYGPWKATYTAGVAEVAEPVEEGITEVVFDLWAQMRGLSADVAESAEQMSITVPPYYRLPPRALAMIKGYELPSFG